MAKRTGKTYRMNYAEKIQYHGTESAKVMHESIQKGIADRIAELKLQITAAVSESMLDVVAYDKAIQEAMQNATKPLMPVETGNTLVVMDQDEKDAVEAIIAIGEELSKVESDYFASMKA